MAGRGPRHHSKDGPRHAASPDPPSIPGPTRPSPGNLDLDAQPSQPPVVGPPHGLQTPPMVIQTPPMAIDQKLASQQAEIQRLLTENQRLAVTHVALRQELAAAQQEIQRLVQSRPADTEKEQRFTFTQVALRQELADAKHEVHRLQEGITAIRSEKDQHIRAALEKAAQMEAELKGADFFKGEFDKIRYERDELAMRVEHFTVEAKKLPFRDEEIASLKNEVDELRQKYQQARMDFELQKKISYERLEQKQAMEKNVFTMAREVEKLRMEAANAERRAHAAILASSGRTAPPALHNPMPQAGVYENNYGSQQDALKNGQNANRSENKPSNEGGRYGAGLEDFKPGMQVSEDHTPKPSAKIDVAGEWSKHSAPNGKSFYYNAVTGATQWDKPPAVAGAEANSVHQRQLQQGQGQAAQDVGPELTSLQQQPQQQLAPVQQQQQQPPQQQPPQQAIPPAVMQQGTQLPAQQGNYGINLLVFGLSEGFGDRDLASLFQPYGAVVYSKVVVDNATGHGKGYGVVTMENRQAAEAAAAAVNGMPILGRSIQVEIQHREQEPHHQGYAQPPMQQNMIPGGVGPVRWHQRGGPTTGRWPY